MKSELKKRTEENLAEIFDFFQKARNKATTREEHNHFFNLQVKIATLQADFKYIISRLNLHIKTTEQLRQENIRLQNGDISKEINSALLTLKHTLLDVLEQEVPEHEEN